MRYNLCYLCHEAEETRPYGEGGQPICFTCMKASPEREAGAVRIFGALLNANAALGDGVVLGDEDGPQPIWNPPKSRHGRSATEVSDVEDV